MSQFISAWVILCFRLSICYYYDEELLEKRLSGKIIEKIASVGDLAFYTPGSGVLTALGKNCMIQIQTNCVAVKTCEISMPVAVTMAHDIFDFLAK